MVYLSCCFRGHDETSQSKNPGVFLGLVNFACNLDPILQEHMSSNTAFKGTSKTIQNEILEFVLFVCKQQIKNEILQTDFLALMTDETTDTQDKSQMVMVLRNKVNKKLVERFWFFFDSPNLTEEAVSAIILKELKFLIDDCAEKLVAQMYNGAANLSGSKGGVQAKVKEHYPSAHFVHCYVHKLNLVVQKSCSQNKNVSVFQ